jgi:hypothetical protein
VAALTLPYEFDTSGPGTTMVRGALGLIFAIVVPGVIYSVFVSHDPAAVVALLIIAALTVYFGRIFLKFLPASRGRITRDAIVVESARVLGLRFVGPEGTFPLTRFRGVVVAQMPPPVAGYGLPHERVTLVGGDGTPDILVARTSLGEGRTFGRDLAATLALPLEEVSLPY